MPRKPAIPPVPKRGDDRAKFDQAVRENIEILTARRAEPITILDPATATAEDCAKKLNEIINRMQQ